MIIKILKVAIFVASLIFFGMFQSIGLSPLFTDQTIVPLLEIVFGDSIIALISFLLVMCVMGWYVGYYISKAIMGNFFD